MSLTRQTPAGPDTFDVVVVGGGNAGLCAALTAREREIVQLLVEGKTNKEVGVSLGVSVKTVDAHRANVMHKLDLHSVTDLVRYAIRNQIIAA